MSQLIFSMIIKAKSRLFVNTLFTLLHRITDRYFPLSSSYLFVFAGYFPAVLSAALSPGPTAQLLPLHFSLVGKCCLKLPSPEILLTCALNLFKFVFFKKYIIFNPLFLFLHCLKLLNFMVL